MPWYLLIFVLPKTPENANLAQCPKSLKPPQSRFYCIRSTRKRVSNSLVQSCDGSESPLLGTTHHARLRGTLLALEENSIACAASFVGALLVDMGQLCEMIPVSALLLEKRCEQNATNHNHPA